MSNKSFPEKVIQFKDFQAEIKGDVTYFYCFPSIPDVWVQTGWKKVLNKDCEYENEPEGVYVVDPRYITADDYHHIDKHCCRVCKRFMKIYEKSYYRETASYGSREVWKMNYGNNYCEDCAKKLSEKKPKTYMPTREKKINKTTGGSITYIASKGWNADPYYDPNAMIIED